MRRLESMTLKGSERIIGKNVDVVVIDTAHADTKSVISTLKKIKSSYKTDVVVGNVSEPESAKRLADAGADGIKSRTRSGLNLHHENNRRNRFATGKRGLQMFKSR